MDGVAEWVSDSIPRPANECRVTFAVTYTKIEESKIKGYFLKFWFNLSVLQIPHV